MSLSLPKNDTPSGLRFALSLHDLRASMGPGAVKLISAMIDEFQCPVTFHIVFDRIPDEGSELLASLRGLTAQGRAEVVFHGLSHACTRKGHRLLSWYHKYQAEYLEDSDELRAGTGEAFEKLKVLLGTNMGICPPCWLAHEKNTGFLRGLEPLYMEHLLSMARGGRRTFSPVVSLGSPVRSELFFLRLLGRLMYLVSLLNRKKGVRVALHVCDLSVPSSVDFFHDLVGRLKKRGYHPVLMRDL